MRRGRSWCGRRSRRRRRCRGRRTRRGRAPIPHRTRTRRTLALIADGLSNRQIAECLHISPSAAGVHVSHILAELGATSRTQARRSLTGRA
ncbi:response regulator transcription factor [Streptomyces sp. NPDC050516]|uniref:response regulator transcription factor n=1 Tax=Streptomyces sp. NPDC050516 TaxID=3365621 RepID=UPI0037A72603